MYIAKCIIIYLFTHSRALPSIEETPAPPHTRKKASYRLHIGVKTSITGLLTYQIHT
jgi:hypothetical protein